MYVALREAPLPFKYEPGSKGSETEASSAPEAESKRPSFNAVVAYDEPVDKVLERFRAVDLVPESAKVISIRRHVLSGAEGIGYQWNRFHRGMLVVSD